MAKSTPDQLQLALGFEPAFGRDDFFEGAANAEALAAIDQTSAWSFPGLIISGEAGSGKTHLATIWSHSVDALLLRMTDLAAGDVATTDLTAILEGRPAVLDDVSMAAIEDEQPLFAVLNACVHGRTRLVITARNHPGLWPVKTPDVASRLKLFPLVEIGPPDDGLLTAVLMKQLADRQISVNANAVSYAIMRLERSFSAIADFVEMVDRLSRQSARKLTRGLARDAVTELSHSGQSGQA